MKLLAFAMIGFTVAMLVLLVSILCALIGATILNGLLRILCWQRNLWWTVRYRGEPITVFFYDTDQHPERFGPFAALVHHRHDSDLVFEADIPCIDLGSVRLARGRLSVAFGSYGTTWCWGHEGEEVEALKVSRALA